VKILLATAITCRRDVLRDTLTPPGVTCVCFSDEPDVNVAKGWDTRPLPVRTDCPVRSSRYVKWCIQRIAPGFDLYVSVNANLFLRGDLTEILGALGASGFGAFRSRFRDCIYEEAEKVRELGLDSDAAISATITELRQVGYPEHQGLHETGVLVQTPDPTTMEIADTIWGRLRRLSVRDQLHFDYVCWLRGVSVVDLVGTVADNIAFGWGARCPSTSDRIRALRRTWNDRSGLRAWPAGHRA
jgi:hypothetical protein